MKPIAEYFRRYREKVAKVFPEKKAQVAFHASHKALHLLYFGFVYLEGHGIYAQIGGLF